MTFQPSTNIFSSSTSAVAWTPSSINTNLVPSFAPSNGRAQIILLIHQPFLPCRLLLVPFYFKRHLRKHSVYIPLLCHRVQLDQHYSELSHNNAQCNVEHARCSSYRFPDFVHFLTSFTNRYSADSCIFPYQLTAIMIIHFNCQAKFPLCSIFCAVIEYQSERSTVDLNLGTPSCVHLDYPVRYFRAQSHRMYSVQAEDYRATQLLGRVQLFLDYRLQLR